MTPQNSFLHENMGKPFCAINCTNIFFLFFSSLLYWAILMAYGSSQAMGRIKAAATDLRHSHSYLDLSCICHLRHSSRQHQILNPLKEARD